MRLFPSSSYSMITHFTPDEIENILLKKSAEHATFVVSSILKLQSGITFNTTFFNTYINDWNYRRQLNDSAPPSITVIATKKENHTLLEVTTELGHTQQSIFVVILSVVILVWLIILGGIMTTDGDLYELVFPSAMIGVILVIGIAIMHLYVDVRNSQSKRFFKEYLKAKMFD